MGYWGRARFAVAGAAQHLAAPSELGGWPHLGAVRGLDGDAVARREGRGASGLRERCRFESSSFATRMTHLTKWVKLD